jgi:hypothetical protein
MEVIIFNTFVPYHVNDLRLPLSAQQDYERLFFHNQTSHTEALSVVRDISVEILR